MYPEARSASDLHLGIKILPFVKITKVIAGFSSAKLIPGNNSGLNFMPLTVSAIALRLRFFLIYPTPTMFFTYTLEIFTGMSNF